MKKNYITFDINLTRAQQLHLTQKQIDKLRIDLKALTVNSIKYKVGYDLLLLRGKKGEAAYVRNDSYYRHPQITLITEFPLSLKAEEQRKWIAMASKFFKPHFTSNIEIAHYKKGFTRTDNSYRVFESDVCDLNEPKQKIHIKMRYKKYSDSDAYGSKTTRKRDLKARNEWIRKRYKQLKKDKSLPKHFTRYEKISTELVSKKFGNLKIINPLDIDTIKNIIYSSHQKISD